MPKTKHILIASDHAAVELKAELMRLLPDWHWVDLGPSSTDRVDYPDFAELLSRRIARGEAPHGILLCGSGIGMCIAANKIPGIRAATAENPISARLAKEHNNVNVLCLGARFLAPNYASEIVQAWLEAKFSEDSRHQIRVKKILDLERK